MMMIWPLYSTEIKEKHKDFKNKYALIEASLDQIGLKEHPKRAAFRQQIGKRVQTLRRTQFLDFRKRLFKKLNLPESYTEDLLGKENESILFLQVCLEKKKKFVFTFFFFFFLFIFV